MGRRYLKIPLDYNKIELYLSERNNKKLEEVFDNILRIFQPGDTVELVNFNTMIVLHTVADITDLKSKFIAQLKCL